MQDIGCHYFNLNVVTLDALGLIEWYCVNHVDLIIYDIKSDEETRQSIKNIEISEASKLQWLTLEKYFQTCISK